MQRKITITVGLVIAALLGAIALIPPNAVIDAVPVLLAAGAVAAVGAVIGVRRTKEAGHLDLFHPLLFPTMYIAVASLAPCLWIWGTGQNLGYVQISAMASRTPLLMALAVVGFALGAGVPLTHSRIAAQQFNPGTLGAAGRLLILIPLALALRDFALNTVTTRGQGQGEFTILDSINVLGFIVGPTAVALILVSRHQQGMALLGKVDAAMVLALVGLLGLNGRRGSALAVMIVVLVFATRKMGANLRVAFGFGAVALFAYVVVIYRTAAQGGRTTLGALPVLLRDLGSVAYTTGVTAKVMKPGSESGGSSIIAGLVRQIPSPIANHFFGPPTDTGAYQFRILTGLASDPKGSGQGYGFSLPAEGYLNFGTIGAFLVPFTAGLCLAWLYSRFNPKGGRAINMLYAVAVGAVPFAWRSDTLGAVKGVLYPGVILWAVIVAPRTVATVRRRFGSKSNPDIEGKANPKAQPVPDHH